MADRDKYLETEANRIHDLEREVARANAAGAGPGRIERINKADRALLEAWQAFDHCLTQQGSGPIKIRR